MKESERLRKLKARSLDEPKAKKRKDKKKEDHGLKCARGSYSELLMQAGLPLKAPIWILLVLSTGIVIGVLAGKTVGALTGVLIVPCYAYYFLSLFVNGKAEKRRRQAIPQLPAFIDTLTASLGTGYNMEAAIQHATTSLPNGTLKKELERSSMLVEKGISLDEALDVLSSRIAGRELVALVITIRLFYDMGGRVLTPFNRLGYKLREQQSVMERATRDLVGVKQAFFVIFGLAVFAPLGLAFSKPDYLLSAFEHPKISYVMQAALITQILCFMIL